MQNIFALFYMWIPNYPIYDMESCCRHSFLWFNSRFNLARVDRLSAFLFCTPHPLFLISIEYQAVSHLAKARRCPD